jgi:hypothetical protein
MVLVLATAIFPEFDEEPIEMTKLRREFEASVVTIQNIQGAILDSKIYALMKLRERIRIGR